MNPRADAENWSWKGWRLQGRSFNANQISSLTTKCSQWLPTALNLFPGLLPITGHLPRPWSQSSPCWAAREAPWLGAPHHKAHPSSCTSCYPLKPACPGLPQEEPWVSCSHHSGASFRAPMVGVSAGLLGTVHRDRAVDRNCRQQHWRVRPAALMSRSLLNVKDTVRSAGRPWRTASRYSADAGLHWKWKLVEFWVLQFKTEGKVFVPVNSSYR